MVIPKRIGSQCVWCFLQIPRCDVSIRRWTPKSTTSSKLRRIGGWAEEWSAAGLDWQILTGLFGDSKQPTQKNRQGNNERSPAVWVSLLYASTLVNLTPKRIKCSISTISVKKQSTNSWNQLNPKNNQYFYVFLLFLFVGCWCQPSGNAVVWTSSPPRTLHRCRCSRRWAQWWSTNIPRDIQDGGGFLWFSGVLSCKKCLMCLLFTWFYLY